VVGQERGVRVRPTGQSTGVTGQSPCLERYCAGSCIDPTLMLFVSPLIVLV
jgi:hypothetical protein